MTTMYKKRIEPELDENGQDPTLTLMSCEKNCDPILHRRFNEEAREEAKDFRCMDYPLEEPVRMVFHHGIYGIIDGESAMDELMDAFRKVVNSK